MHVNDPNKRWVAYCTTCKAAIEECQNGHFAEGAARDHVRKNPEHQVIVGQEILGREYGVCAEP